MSQPASLGRGAEFDTIRSIVAELGNNAGPLWDDTGLLPITAGQMVASTDLAVEGIHFKTEWLTPEEIGWRAGAAALSDLAAAAASPVGILVALTIPSGLPGTLPAELMRGVAAAGKTVGTKVVGGDLSSGPVISLAVTVVGQANPPMSRRGAVPGNSLWITGEIGGARAALNAWQDGRIPPPAARSAFAHPRARIFAARWLSSQGATAMIDLSDGLAGDVHHLAAASAVGIGIDLGLLPVHPSVYAEAERGGEPPACFAAVGGEDYELLVAMPEDFDDAFGLESTTGVALRRVGRVEAEPGVRLNLDGQPRQLSSFNHEI